MVAGTMDVAGHVAGIAGKMKARMQVSNGGNTLTVKFENIKFAEYVGPFDSPNSWPFDGLNVSCIYSRDCMHINSCFISVQSAKLLLKQTASTGDRIQQEMIFTKTTLVIWSVLRHDSLNL